MPYSFEVIHIRWGCLHAWSSFLLGGLHVTLSSCEFVSLKIIFLWACLPTPTMGWVKRSTNTFTQFLVILPHYYENTFFVTHQAFCQDSEAPTFNEQTIKSEYKIIFPGLFKFTTQPKQESIYDQTFWNPFSFDIIEQLWTFLNLDHSRTFFFILEPSWTVLNLLEPSWNFMNLLESSWTFWTLLGPSWPFFIVLDPYSTL